MNEKEMDSYNVYRHADRGFESVKEGFSWWGFGLFWAWAFFNHLWLQGGLFFLLWVSIMFLEIFLGFTRGALQLFLLATHIGICIAIGTLGNKWIANALIKHGYQHIGKFRASSAESALEIAAKSRGSNAG